MSFLNNLKREDNKTITTNGEIAYKSTLNKVLDLSTKIGNSRFESDFNGVLADAFLEDKLLTSKLIAYARDVRGGGGDKNFGRLGFYAILKSIDVKNVRKFLDIAAEFGSYKDIMYLLDPNLVEPEKLKEICFYLEKQLQEDDKSDNPSLLAKWMPTETTKDGSMKNAYRVFMACTNITPKEYRKRNTRIRNKLKIVEHNLTEKDYESIDYSKVPSQASLKYRDAFVRNDYDKYNEYIEKVARGEEKINTGTLAPYQIVDKYNSQSFYGSIQTNNTLEQLWAGLKRPDTKGLNVLPVVDVSGSMYGLPLNVAVSLGIILAESMSGEFKNHFMTFSNKPKLVELHGDTLADKVYNMQEADWGMNTNLEAVFDLVLSTAIKNNTPQDEIPQAMIIFSDMQMDSCVHGSKDKTFFEKMKERFEESGYKLPFLVFWNIGYFGNQPVVKDEYNTINISGFSQNIFDSIFNLDLDNLENYTPLNALLEILNQDRYKVIEELYE